MKKHYIRMDRLTIADEVLTAIQQPNLEKNVQSNREEEKTV